MARKVPASSTRSPGQRVNVEKSAVVDVAAGQPPIRQPIVLALEQMVQGEPGSRFTARRLIDAQAALDDILAVP